MCENGNGNGLRAPVTDEMHVAYALAYAWVLARVCACRHAIAWMRAVPSNPPPLVCMQSLRDRMLQRPLPCQDLVQRFVSNFEVEDIHTGQCVCVYVCHAFVRAHGRTGGRLSLRHDLLYEYDVDACLRGGHCENGVVGILTLIHILTHTGFALCDESGGILWCNREFAEPMGYSEQEVPACVCACTEACHCVAVAFTAARGVDVDKELRVCCHTQRLC